MKRTSLVVMCLTLLATGAPHCDAAEFGPDSASLDHPYFTWRTGAGMLMTGYGNHSLEYEYGHIAGIESVDGVRCVKGVWVRTQPSELSAAWFAKDLMGDLYILKYWDGHDPAPVILGKDHAMLMAPKNPRVGDLLVGGDLIVVETGVTVPQLSTGVGPFSNCLKAVFPDGDVVYLAPGLWSIKEEDHRGTGGMELKEVTEPQNGVVVIPLAAD